jgi:hypothetical protein
VSISSHNLDEPLLWIAAGSAVLALIAALAAAEALPRSGAELVSNGVFSLTLPLWPIGAALALAALGVVFRHGAVLQRETEGLV